MMTKTRLWKTSPILQIGLLLALVGSAFSIGIPPQPSSRVSLVSAVAAPIGDGKADDTAAIQAMIDDPALFGVVRLKPGTYRCSAPLKNNARTIRLIGDGVVTVLLFTKDTPGLILSRKPSGEGDRTLIQSICLRSQGGTDPTAHGIQVSAGRLFLDDVMVEKFPGNGVELNKSNLWNLDRAALRYNGGHGFHLYGSDVNAGLARNLDIVGNKGWGILEEGVSLGSTYIGCHAAANILGAYSIGGNDSSSVLVGCYSESGQPKTKLGQRVICIGGAQGAGFDPTNVGNVIGHDFLGWQVTQMQEVPLYGKVVIGAASIPPRTGTRGKYLLNQYPNTGLPIGWVCTKSSTDTLPAVWKPLGNLP